MGVLNNGILDGADAAEHGAFDCFLYTRGGSCLEVGNHFGRGQGDEEVDVVVAGHEGHAADLRDELLATTGEGEEEEKSRTMRMNMDMFFRDCKILI
eukprot:evm.model.NODE_10154_length_4284_cov_20.161299.3